jgi:ABC-type iron transport system FetAB permease component
VTRMPGDGEGWHRPPVEAVKYQILVMFLIAGGTGLG